MNTLKKYLLLVTVFTLANLTQCMEYNRNTLTQSVYTNKRSIKKEKRTNQNFIALEKQKNDLRESLSEIGLTLKDHHRAIAKIKPKNNAEQLMLENIANKYAKLQMNYNNITNKPSWRSAKHDLNGLDQLTGMNDYTYLQETPSLATLAAMRIELEGNAWDLAEDYRSYNIAIQLFLSYRDEQEQDICSIS